MRLFLLLLQVGWLGSCAVSSSSQGAHELVDDAYAPEERLATLDGIHTEKAAMQFHLRVTKSKEQQQLAALQQRSATLKGKVQQLETKIKQADIKTIKTKRTQQRLIAKARQIHQKIAAFQTQMQNASANKNNIEIFQVNEKHLQRELDNLKNLLPSLVFN